MDDAFDTDLQYLYFSLQSHPSLVYEENRIRFMQLYEDLKQTLKDEYSFLQAMTKLTMFFNDGHTNIELPYTDEDLCLPLRCEWEDGTDRLFLKEKYADIDAGAEITAVEGASVHELLKRAQQMIPHENRYLVRSRMLHYPYQNYHIFSRLNLIQLFGEKETYEIKFCMNRQEWRKSCRLTTYQGFPEFSPSPAVCYELEGNTAILHLNACVYNKYYQLMLDRLADICQKKRMERLILDLSKNMGGNSAVIDEFIARVNVDSYRRFGMIDYSSGSPCLITDRNVLVKNRKRSKLFPNNIICRVSNDTFSSAKTFAVTLKDNGIAAVVGQPTGGKPTSYGMPRKDVTPCLHIRFRVSRCLFLRPDPAGDKEISLFPQTMSMRERTDGKNSV